MVIIWLIFLVGFGFLCFRRLDWGIYVITAALPSYLIRFEIWGMPITWLEGMIGVLGLMWFFNKLAGRELGEVVKGWQKNGFFWLGLGLMAAAGISVCWTPDKFSALGIWGAYFFQPLVFGLILMDVIRKRGSVRKVIGAVFLGMTFLALGSLGQYVGWFSGPDNYLAEGRLTSFFDYPAAAALYSGPILVFVLGLWILRYWSGGARWLVLGGVLISGWALFMSRAEGGWVGFLVGILVVAILSKYRWWVVGGIGLLLAGGLFLPADIKDYLWAVITFTDVSGEVRLVLWEGSWRMVQANPLWGVGLANFPNVYAEFKEARHVELVLYPHNVFLNFWLETGLLGLLFFLGLLGVYARNIWRGIKGDQGGWKRKVAMGLAGAMTCLMVYGLVDVPYFKNDLAMMFWILLGLSQEVGRKAGIKV